MKTLINKYKVSHIYIRKAHKVFGEYEWKEGWCSKYLWGLYKEYYKPGYYSNMSFMDPRYEVEFYEFVKGGYLYYKPSMRIFCGGELIKEIYKDTVEELLKICEDKFDNINVQIK